MDVLSYHSRPDLRHPVLIAAFKGWNDAGEAATTAVAFLRKVWGAKAYASVDPEEFFDFTVQRPQVTLVDGITRQMTWPETEFSHATIEGLDRDALVLQGIEPSMRWRTFSDTVLGVAKDAGVEMVITLGALLADVPHSRPVRVTGTAPDPDLAERLGLENSRYEGPTGIVGVLHEACRRSSIPSVSLWAAVPHYVSQAPSPKAALELITRLASLLGTEVNTTELEESARQYEERVAAAVEADPDIAAHVRMLEQRSDEEDLGAGDLPSADDLAEQFEKFLKDLGESEQ